MGIVISAPRLQQELVRRGWTRSQLAKSADISPATVTAALGGRPLSPGTVRRIAEALTGETPIQGVDSLLL